MRRWWRGRIELGQDRACQLLQGGPAAEDLEKRGIPATVDLAEEHSPGVIAVTVMTRTGVPIQSTNGIAGALRAVVEEV